MIAIDTLGGTLKENDTVVCFKEIHIVNCQQLPLEHNLSLPRPGYSYTVSSIGTDKFRNQVQLNGFYSWFPADDFYKKDYLPTKVNESAYKSRICVI